MKKRFTRIVIGAVVLSLTWGLAPGISGAAPGAFPIRNMSSEQWSPSYMGGKAAATTDVEAIARRFTVLAVQGGTFTKAQVDRMRAVRPEIKLLVYINGSLVQKTDGPTTSKYPISWYAKDVNGNHPQSRNFGSWLMKMWQEPWMANRAQTCKDQIAKNYGANGCFVDMLGVAPIHGTYMTALPVDDNGNKWNDQNWMAATSALVNRIASDNPGSLIIGNGLASGRYYFNMGTNQLVNTQAQGAMAELWGRGAHDGITKYKSEATWKQDVDMVVDMANKGKSLFATVKLWVANTPAQARSWHEYTLGSFLLGTDGNQFYNFSTAKTFSGMVDAQPSYESVDIGQPNGAYSKAGCYQRDFSKGFVAVNPTIASCTVTLPPGNYTDLEGNSHTGSVTLLRNTAEVLTRTP